MDFISDFIKFYYKELSINILSDRYDMEQLAEIVYLSSNCIALQTFANTTSKMQMKL